MGEIALRWMTIGLAVACAHLYRFPGGWRRQLRANDAPPLWVFVPVLLAFCGLIWPLIWLDIHRDRPK